MIAHQLAHKGMTLIEVLAVVVILGLLAATLTVGITGKLGKAKTEIAKTQIAQIAGAVETFRLDKRRLPTAAEGLNTLTESAEAPYFLGQARLSDPWGKEYLYLVPGPDGVAYEILTYGADGRQGGTGENADVSSSSLQGGTKIR